MNIDNSHAIPGRTATVSPFKQALAFHKRDGNDHNRLDDLARVLDLSRKTDHEKHGIFPINVPKLTDASGCDDAVESYFYGPMFGIAKFPGVLFAPQALSQDLQHELAYESVVEYCESPHRTNIDLCPPKVNETINRTEDDVDESMWSLWKQHGHVEDEVRNNVSAPAGEPSSNKKAKRWHPSSSNHATRYYKSFNKLSWATMGYHYDWTERSYNKDNKSTMPPLVASLATIFGRTSLRYLSNTEEGDQHHNETKHSRTRVSFLPTASIVNYYNIKSTMGGHRDDLELALDKPIVSISLGLPSVFILGGTSKQDDQVVAILLRPGDVLCMGGESRLNYHAMARVLPIQAAEAITREGVGQNCVDSTKTITLSQMRGSREHHLSQITATDEPFLSYFLRQHRININVRQVYPDETESG
jgi:DNA alkylation damage repair protein AlkB